LSKLDALLIDALKSEVELLEGAIDKNRIMRERLRRKLYLIFFKRSNTLCKPPTSAEFIARLFIPRENRDAILGDLEEDYHKHVEKLGERRAKLIYWADVIRSIWPFVSAFVLKLSLLQNYQAAPKTAVIVGLIGRFFEPTAFVLDFYLAMSWFS